MGIPLGGPSGATALPALSGFNAAIAANALGAAPPSGVTAGVPGQGGQMVNPLAQALAGLGPQYQPGDTSIHASPAAGLGALPPIRAGESSMGYMQRIGMSQPDANSALAASQQNPHLSFQDIISQGGYNIPGITSGRPGFGMAGDRLMRFTPQLGALAGGTGGTAPGGSTGSGPSPSPSGNSGSSGGLPAINPGEDSLAYMLRLGMSPADAEAALRVQQNNPNLTFQQIIALTGYRVPGYNTGPATGSSNTSGTTGGSSGGGAGGGSIPGYAQNWANNGTGGTAPSGNLPPINAGEDPMAYMLRIGMSQADAQAARQLAVQNPNLTFQQIIAQGGYRIPGYNA